MGTIVYNYNDIVRINGSLGTIEIEGANCIACDLCIPECPENALTTQDFGVEVGGVYNHKADQLKINVLACTGCGQCAYACSATEAIRIHYEGGGSGNGSNGNIFGDYNDGLPNPPTAPGPGPGPNPCSDVPKSKSKITNTNTKKNNKIIKDSIEPGGWEYGADEKLNSLTAGDYKDLAPSTIQSKNSWLPSFTWNPTDGYSTGFSHSHTDGTSGSPPDVFALLHNLSHPQLANASSYDKAFYKTYASFTVISSNGTWVITIANWNLLSEIYDKRFIGKEKDFNDSYNALADRYKRNYPDSTEGEASAYALKAKLGDSIHVFKKNDNDDDVKPQEIGPTNNSNGQTIYKFLPTNCP